MPKPVTPARLRRYARRYLGRYFTARGHLRRLMMRRVDKSLREHGGDRDQAARHVEAILDDLEAEGALDDERFARDRAKLLHERGDSLRKIRSKLRDKLVDSSVIGRVIDALRDEYDQPDLKAAAAYVRKRRLGPWRDDPAAHREKDLARLARAGFSYGVARQILDQPTPAAVEAIELDLPPPG